MDAETLQRTHHAVGADHIGALRAHTSMHPETVWVCENKTKRYYALMWELQGPFTMTEGEYGTYMLHGYQKDTGEDVSLNFVVHVAEIQSCRFRACSEDKVTIYIPLFVH